MLVRLVLAALFAWLALPACLLVLVVLRVLRLLPVLMVYTMVYVCMLLCSVTGAVGVDIQVVLVGSAVLVPVDVAVVWSHGLPPSSSSLLPVPTPLPQPPFVLSL